MLPPVYITQSGRSRLFCSDACRSARYPPPSVAQRGPRPCRFCGWTFSSSHAGHVFCSTDCSNAASGKVRRTSRFTVFSWDECATCGEFWMNMYAQQTRCPPCAASAKRARIAFRRATHRGAIGNHIDPDVIFDRDGWVCQLCNLPVLHFVRFPHPRSPSIDHILPVSLGGQHVESNVQLAHFGCNSAKRDRVAA